MAGTWTTINCPWGNMTETMGMSGSNIVGMSHSDVWNGFIYNGLTYTRLSMPGATQTLLFNASGSNIVGVFDDSSLNSHGWLYNDTTKIWNTIDKSGATDTYVYGISANVMVGYYHTPAGQDLSFRFDGTTWANISMPGALITYTYGIDGNKYVGEYMDPSTYNNYGFYYDGQNWITLNFIPRDIDGSYIVGQNVVYNTITKTSFSLNAPGAGQTRLMGVNGDKIFGYYDSHGFVYTIPEPATLLLLGLGARLCLRASPRRAAIVRRKRG